MKKIIIYDSIHERAIKFLEQENDVQIFCVEAENRSKLLSLLPSADGIILRYLAFDEELIKVAHNLKTISRHGVGYDNIDIKSATDCGIPVTTIGDVNAVTVSELTMYFILAAAKQGLKYDQAVRENNWQIREELDSFELFNKNILIIGFGRIGSRVAPRVKSFESKVFVCDPYISQDIITKSGYIAVTDWREAIGDMDIVTLHVPLTDETKYMIDDNVIKNMKTGAILVNAARGALVDSFALATALEEGKVFGAGLDVFEPEPPNKDHQLVLSNRTILTPHVGALTLECSIRSSMKSAENVLSGINGKFDANVVVNKEALKS